jgi:hypothetical protein
LANADALNVKIWLGAIKQDACMLTSLCQILMFEFLCFYLFNILCIVEHPKLSTLQIKQFDSNNSTDCQPASLIEIRSLRNIQWD